MIRYRTRDLTRLLPPTARTMRRMEKITGRSDDMLIIRGVNVFPSQIEELILKTAGPEPALRARGHQGRARSTISRWSSKATPTATAALAHEHQVLHRHQRRGAHRHDRALHRQGEARHRQAAEMKGLSKTVLVTGGGGAIGSALCRRFARGRRDVLVADLNREARRARGAARSRARRWPSISPTIRRAREASWRRSGGCAGEQRRLGPLPEFPRYQARGVGAPARHQPARAAQHAPHRRARDAGARRRDAVDQHLLRRGARRLLGRSGLFRLQGRHHRVLQDARPRGGAQGRHRQRRHARARPTRRSCAAFSARAMPGRSTTRRCGRSR